MKNSILAALILFFVTHSAHALDPSQPVSSYIRTHFTESDNGLPSNVVHYIEQSRDGFLWVTFGSGTLARFDGQNFTKLPIALTGSIALAPNGDLWVGTGRDLKQ